jgi:hypothetical protein
MRVASTVAVGPFDDPDHASATVSGYQRFLAVSGRHLALLLSARGDERRHPGNHAAATPARAVASRLSRLDAVDAGASGTTAWTRCGDRLGAAHDIVATHLGPHGELRTPEARELTDPVIRHAAADRVVALTRQPLAVAPELLAAVTAAQPRHDPPVPPAAIIRLRRATTALRRLLATTPLTVAPDPGLLQGVDGMMPARPKIAEYADSATVGGGLQALSVLRILSQRQATGEEPTNAHSLHDLCRLAVATVTVAERLLPPALTPLRRVDRVATLDRLRAAAVLWLQADQQLYPRVQAVVRAPRVYLDAITVLTGDCPASPLLTRAVLATLPRLATDAADTLRLHATGNGLVVARRDPGQLVRRWRPIEPALAAELADALHAAGQASRTASTALNRHLDTPTTDRNHTVAAQAVNAVAAELPRQRRRRPGSEVTP